MKKRLITILQYLFFLGIGVFFVWLSVKDIHHAQWLQIKEALAQARHWLIIPALVMLLVSHYSRALRWKLLMEPMGYHPSTFNVFAAVMIGYLVNTGVPRLGEVVKCSILARYENVRVDRLFGTIVMERAVDVVCLIIVFACALIFEGRVINEHIFARIGSFFQDPSGHTSMRKVALILGVLVGGLALVSYLLKRFSHIDAVAKVKNVLAGILHGLGSIRMVQHKGLFLFHTVFIWGLYLAATTMGIYALQETSHLGVGGGLTTLALGSIGMLIAPGGIGAYAWIVAKLMGWYGLDETTIGNALGWLLWSVQTGIVLLGGLLFFGLLSYFNKKQKPRAPGNSIPQKLHSLDSLLQQVARWRLLGKTIAFTNGCFDILHAGHIASFTDAAQHGDILIVGVNTDASVKKLKGPHRPVNTEKSRALLIASLVMVDAVILFGDDTPRDVIIAIRPDALVKGGDYKVEDIAGAKEVLAWGGKVFQNPIVPGFSTTALIDKIQHNDNARGLHNGK